MNHGKILLLITSLLLIGAIVSFSALNSRETNKGTVAKVIPIAEKIDTKCTRTTRLENKPQYERALSIIDQRINESIEREKKTGPNTILPAFRYFPPELLNCIYIKEDETGEAEGYFSTSKDDIKSNYFSIHVSPKYSQTDDLTTAVLLVHEITHVQQYLERASAEEKYTYKIKDCLYDEARAFVAQYEFYSNLNVDEVDSLGMRMFSNSENPQTRMLSLLRDEDIKAGDVCGLDLRCTREVLRVAMENHIGKDEFYSKQCNK